MGNPTLSDVAKLAGVSYATADRVVNGRANVAEKSVQKVREAIETLGYVRNVSAANLSQKRIYKFAFLLPSGPNAFFARVRSGIEAQLSHLALDQVQADILEFGAFEPEQLASGLRAVAGRNYDGIAIVGFQKNELESEISELRGRGTKVISLISDLLPQHREAYVGIDNVMAGRTAARLLGLAHGGQDGSVQVLAGSLRARDHVDRYNAFVDVIRSDFSNIKVLSLIETRDDARTVSAVVTEALSIHPNMSAVYNVGAGNSGLIEALQKTPRPDRFFCAVHELVEHSRLGLEQGLIDLVIDQGAEIEVERAFSILRSLADRRAYPPSPELVPTIYVKDNLPRNLIPTNEMGPMQ